jgi:hypothetical protein
MKNTFKSESISSSGFKKSDERTPDPDPEKIWVWLFCDKSDYSLLGREVVWFGQKIGQNNSSLRKEILFLTKENNI